MTPVVRTDKITKALNVTMEADRVKSAIEQGISSGAIDLPVICMSVKQMCDSVGVAKTQRNSFFEDVQALYDSRVLLRGKDITCPHCLSRIWLTIESVESRIHCPECGNGVNMPVVEEGDSYKLNRLVARALDQGQLATFLLMHFLRANFRIIDCFPNLEVFEGGALKTDVDLVVRLGRRVGLAECKSRSGFDNDQVDTLIQLAAASRCDFAILSTLLPKDAPEVRDSFERLLSRNLAFPVFFVTESALLGSERPSLTQFFEYGRAGIPHTGPIMV
jgi:DNA-directed RNA polymerase subunit RPC12/RpoP